MSMPLPALVLMLMLLDTRVAVSLPSSNRNTHPTISQGVLPDIRVGWSNGDQYPLGVELLLQLTTANQPPQHALHVR